MNAADYERLIELLEEAKLSSAASDCLLAAAAGPAELAAHLSGSASGERPRPATRPPPDPARVYLEEISVEGFRGVGARARLQFAAGPGMTLVVGRNGSGKSSFAEGLEVLLTGTTLRWEERTKVWQEGWRNLHHDGAVSLSARFRVDGEAQPLELSRSWPVGAPLGSGQAVRVGGPRGSWDALGWQGPLERFRPILSYNELGTMFSSRAAVLYEALSAVLGLEDFDATQACLRDGRLAFEKTVKAEKLARAALEGQLQDSDDPRASAAVTQIRRRAPDVEAVTRSLAIVDATGRGDVRPLASLALPAVELVTERFARASAARRRIDELAVGDASRLDSLADLIETGLAFRTRHSKGERDCPLCETSDALDDGWPIRADARAQELRRSSCDLREARQELAAARAAAAELFAAPTRTSLDASATAALDVAAATDLWRAWSALVEGDDGAFLAQGAELARRLHAALAEARRRAEAEQEHRDLAWQPLRDAITEWTVLARRTARDKPLAGAVKEAEAWMGSCMAGLRSERLAPVIDAAKANWSELQHESNVALGGVELRKSGSQRYAAFDVAVDGSDASAFGVMSQGELSALAISVFLPRAMLPGSPFAFIVIDDPVQSMDPAKVDGLARVLAAAAGRRQVIVFTHDERLPEAVRRLDIDARIMQVQRRARSLLEIVAGRPPSDRHIGEAFAIAKAQDLPAEVRARVVPVLCRSAIEAACEARIRRRLLDGGMPHAEVEERLAAITSLTEWLGLALGYAVSQGREITAAVRRLGGDDAVEVVSIARKGAHQLVATDGLRLTQGAKLLVRALEDR